MTRFDVDHFIIKFGSKQVNQWPCGEQRLLEFHYDAGEFEALESLFSVLGKVNPVRVADGRYYELYQQRTPRLRVLTALRDIKRKMAKDKRLIGEWS